MKKACIIIHRLGVGGAEQMVVGEIRELLRRGISVRLITLSPEREHSLMPFVPAECAREIIPFRTLLDPRGLGALAHALRDINPDIIITQLWYANAVGRIAARLVGMQRRVFAFEQNVYDQVKSWKQYLLDRLLQGWCNKIIAISESVRISLIAHGIRAHRILVIHNAIDIARCADAAPSAIRGDLSIGDAFVYLFVGRLVRQKAVDVLLPAFAQQESGVLILAGDGENRAQLVAQAAALGITSRVFFLGVRHDVPSLMKSADCFVLPSRWEGFGVVLAEALACGLPVVATTVDGIREVVEDGVSGILVSSEDVEALAGALRTMRTDLALRARMKAAAPARAKRFSIEQHIDEVLAIPV